MKAQNKNINFTEGSIIGNMVLFSVPIIFGELFQNLYQSADAMIVGNFVGKNALAAVTICGFISQLIVSFFNGMSVGSNVVVSKAFGRGDKSELRLNVRTAFSFSVITGAVLSMVGILLAPVFLRIAGTSEELFLDALQYLRIYLAGVMFTVIYNSGAGILRAIGQADRPFWILLFTCVLNLVLDLLFVCTFRMGIFGAGLATVISQGVSVINIYTAITRFLKEPCIDIKEMKEKGRPIIAAVMDVGISAGLQGALISISNLSVARYINQFDTAAVAGIGIAQRVDKFIILPTKSFGITMTTFVSQNLGAKKYDRVKKGLLRCVMLAFLVTFGLSTAVMLFKETCVGMFNSAPDVISVGTRTLNVFVPFIGMMAIREILLGILRGYGRTKMPMLLSLAGMIGVRQFYLVTAMGIEKRVEHIFWCYPIAWTATASFLLVYFFFVRKQLPGLEGKLTEK